MTTDEAIEEFIQVLKDWDNFEPDMAGAGIDPPVEPTTFIRSLLSRIRQEERETFEKMIPPLQDYVPKEHHHTGYYRMGWNSCVVFINHALTERKGI